MAANDELYELRNYFFLGNLTAAHSEGETLSALEGAAKIERDVIMARIQVARGEYDAVINGVAADATPALKVVQVLAALLKDASTADVAAATIASWLADTAADAPCFATMCAIVYAHLGDTDAALRTANRERGLEARAVATHVLLRMDRADAAAKEVAHMQRIDEDATITQLASAWTKLASGGADVQEAVYIFQDLLERHGATDAILNGLALCALARGRPDEAERSLQEALAKNPNCASTLINAVVTARYRNKPSELIARYVQQLARVAPGNSWLKQYNAKESEFDGLATQLEAA